jgi:hypothetical protein
MAAALWDYQMVNDFFATIRADEKNRYLNHHPGRHPPRWLR